MTYIMTYRSRSIDKLEAVHRLQFVESTPVAQANFDNKGPAPMRHMRAEHSFNFLHAEWVLFG